ncbi:MAG TPA: hypothetical protein VF170_17440 [Planctomycetaceae bacterium]
MDLLKELRLRRWARENYVPAERRAATWHPVVLDEMRRRDEELAAEPLTDMVSAEHVASESIDDLGSRIVPLAPITYSFDPPHLGPSAPHFLSKPAREAVAADLPDWGFYFG